jgi:GNAT superfamily N-acetyltransferase
MPLSIRPAQPADARLIADFNALLAEESEGKSLDRTLLEPGVLAVLHDPAKGRYFIAQDGPDVLGQMMITYEWSDWRNGWFWWIQSVYVRPEARRRGVFTALFDHVLESARNDGNVIGLRLYVEEANTRAHQTYEKLGLHFTTYQVMERYPLLPKGPADS